MTHTGHELYYCMNGVTTAQPARINEDGWVDLIGPVEIDDIAGDVYMYCRDCGTPVRGGEDGLAEDWEAEWPAEGWEAE